MNVIVVSPHPDDETLGAAGTLLKYKDMGNNIYWLNITNMKEEYGYDSEKIKKREYEINEVKNKYDFDGFYDLELRPAYLDSYDNGFVINKISKIFEEVKPNIVILPNHSDAHSDHKEVFDWCYSCTKVFRHPYINTILTMEILSETDFGPINDFFVPNYFVDISQYFQKKLDILQIYESEIGLHPFPRSKEGIESIAKYRGISAGTQYAEAFKVIKIIN